MKYFDWSFLVYQMYLGYFPFDIQTSGMFTFIDQVPQWYKSMVELCTYQQRESKILTCYLSNWDYFISGDTFSFLYMCLLGWPYKKVGYGPRPPIAVLFINRRGNRSSNNTHNLMFNYWHLWPGWHPFKRNNCVLNWWHRIWVTRCYLW